VSKWGEAFPQFFSKKTYWPLKKNQCICNRKFLLICWGQNFVKFHQGNQKNSTLSCRRRTGLNLPIFCIFFHFVTIVQLTFLSLLELQITVEWPYVLSQSLIYGTIVYAMIQFEWTAAKFFLFLFFMYFALLYFTYWGMVTVAFTPNIPAAAIISTAFYGLWNLFSGFLIPRPVCSLAPNPALQFTIFSIKHNHQCWRIKVLHPCWVVFSFSK